MGGRDAVRMTPHEVGTFLSEHMKVQVGTVDRDGSPHLTTLFYVLDEGRVAFWTYGRSQKIRNLERDPRISLLVEDGDDYSALRGVSIRGRAEIVRDPERLLAIGTGVAMRMVGVTDVADLGDVGRGEVARQAAKRVAVLVSPDHVASWDHHKMFVGHRAAQQEGQGQA